MIILTWDYKHTNNPQRVVCRDEHEAKTIKKHVKRSIPELGPQNFKTETTEGEKS